MTIRSLALGLVLTALLFGVFYYLGPYFFIDGRRPFQINFAVGAALGLALGLIASALGGAPRAKAVRAMALIAVPGLLIMAAVGSHFAVFFPALDPALDKVFGSWMLWFYGFALTGALLRAGRS
ncbi:MAG TPA: DUF5367 family protein [Saliniramus sp.]|nr:DUF5367 family protein [Saliniramus sp.]